ncbi:hypothetical protein B0H14DRAFT_2614169 [Mycena olivaceomarginata]|nr:hypothetical protein B0H14DRAFT_2614169 [Mycena olivaceomarginata]
MPAAAVVPRFTVAGAAQAQQTLQRTTFRQSVPSQTIGCLAVSFKLLTVSKDDEATVPAKPRHEPSTDNLLAQLCDGPQEKSSPANINFFSRSHVHHAQITPLSRLIRRIRLPGLFTEIKPSLSNQLSAGDLVNEGFSPMPSKLWKTIWALIHKGLVLSGEPPPQPLFSPFPTCALFLLRPETIAEHFVTYSASYPVICGCGRPPHTATSHGLPSHPSFVDQFRHVLLASLVFKAAPSVGILILSSLWIPPLVPVPCTELKVALTRPLLVMYSLLFVALIRAVEANMNTARGVLKGLSGKSTWVTHPSLAARVPKGASSAQVTYSICWIISLAVQSV